MLRPVTSTLPLSPLVVTRVYTKTHTVLHTMAEIVSSAGFTGGEGVAQPMWLS